MSVEMRAKLLESYRGTVKVTKQLLEAASTEEDAKIIRSMVSDLNYARQYLKCGYDPNDWNSGIHQREQLSSYHNRRVLLDTDLFAVRDHMEIFGDVLQCDRTIEDIDKQKIQYVLADLTERQLTCYLLHYAHTRTYEQIAEELGLKASTVQNHIERAREKVKIAVKELNKTEMLQHSL